jgi:hypothetical protein
MQPPVLTEIKTVNKYIPNDIVFIISIRNKFSGSTVNNFLKKFDGQLALVKTILPSKIKPYVLEVKGGTLRADEIEISFARHLPEGEAFIK